LQVAAARDAGLPPPTLISPAVEGIHSVELGNAMLLSGLTERAVKLPIDGAEYTKTLEGLIAQAEAKAKQEVTASAER
jgi:hypothetical protein